jgi:photosystem II stability/assembly factor-like uncharacterized protein
MPEPDFAGLRDQLERQVRQPAFAEIRARRLRRTRWVVVGTAVVLVLVVAGAASANAYLRPFRPPVTGPLPPVSPTPAPLSPGTAAVAVSPSGTVFLASSCLAGCAQPGDRFGDAVWRSTDSGATWTRLGSAPSAAAGTLLAVSDAELWLVDDLTYSVSTDGGRNWQGYSLGGDSNGSSAYAATAGGSVWLVQGGVVAMSAGGADATVTPAQPPDVAHPHGLVVFGPDSAAVLTGNPTATWFVTNDRGAHWAPLADPCRNTPYPGSPYATMGAAPDGGRWVVCAAAPATGRQGKQLVTSTDGGRTWRSRGSLEPAGYATRVVPFSANAAWRTGPGGEVYRTTDGEHWSPVATTGDQPGESADLFAALDADTAAYLRSSTLYVTHDGGVHWSGHPVPRG